MDESLNVTFTTATPGVVERWGSEGAKLGDVILLWHNRQKAYVLEVDTVTEALEVWEQWIPAQQAVYLQYMAHAVTDLYEVVMADHAEEG